MKNVSSLPVKMMDNPPPIKVQSDWFPFEYDQTFNPHQIIYKHLSKIETNKADCVGEDGSTYLDSLSSPDSVGPISPCEDISEDFRVHRVPLPYLIRPCKKPDELIGFDPYDYFYSDTDGSDCLLDDGTDEEDYVILDDVESLPNSEEASDKSELLDPSFASLWVGDEHSEDRLGKIDNNNFAGYDSEEDSVNQRDAGYAAESDESDWMIVM